MKTLKAHYDHAFYDDQMAGSYQSAAVYARHLDTLLAPRKVVDVGCGRGTWLKAFGELGATELRGYDGSWNSQANMVDNTIVFEACDLNQLTLAGERRFDLAISLEVAEHLLPATAPSFTAALAALSDAVLFSAAFPKQGGTNHINEQPHTYWARNFEKSGYVPFDVFRPVYWADERVEPWYRQNAFVYARVGSASYDKLCASGLSPIGNLEFMNCMHPAIYQWQIAGDFKTSLKLALRWFRQTLAARF